MNRYQNEPPEEEPEIPEEPEASLPDPNADEPAWGPEPASQRPAAIEGQVPQPAPQPQLPEAAELARQNELLKQQAIRAQQAAQQAAANQVQTWLAAQPPEKQAEYRRIIEDQMREAEDKRRVMWTIAQREGLQGQHLQDFYEEAQAIADPYTMEKVGQRFKRWQDFETKGGAAAPKQKPAMASVRPDAGAPQGNRAGGNRKRQEEILKPFMPGGAKHGKIEELELTLAQNGYYG